MKIELLSGYDAAAHAAKLAGVEFLLDDVNIAKKLKRLFDNRYRCEIGSSLSAAMAASALGKRVMVSASFDIEQMRKASALRLPIVFVSKEAIDYRDAGFLIFAPESNQEILDSIIIAYRLCENACLPAIIGIDDPEFREPVELLTEQFCAKFLPKPRARYIGTKTILPDSKKSVHSAFDIEKSLKKINDELKKVKKSFEPVERYMLDDAEYVFVLAGSQSTTAKAAINKMRATEKVGLLRIRTIRPWPEKEIKSISDKKIIVIENSMSPGKTGIINSEMALDSLNIITQKRLSESDFSEFLKKSKAGERGVQFYGM